MEQRQKDPAAGRSVAAAIAVPLVRSSRAQAEIVLLQQKPHHAENRAAIQSLRIENRNALQEIMTTYDSLTAAGVDRPAEYSHLKAPWFAVAEPLMKAGIELSETAAERIVLIQRLQQRAVKTEQIVCQRNKLKAEGGTIQAVAAATAARIEFEIAMHRERVAAGEVNDPDGTQLREMQLHRWAALLELATATETVWKAGVVMVDGRNPMVDYCEAVAELANAELPLRSEPPHRIAVWLSAWGARKQIEESIEAKVRAGMQGGTVESLAAAKAARLETEIELLRERIRCDYWGPAIGGPPLEPPPQSIIPQPDGHVPQPHLPQPIPPQAVPRQPVVPPPGSPNEPIAPPLYPPPTSDLSVTPPGS